ncbi:Sphingoid long chain base kinase 4 {ECO:0000250/UniProtKB:Q12246} Short=LCB kinase 4 {ECO:0000250/UniProtKB:Q12246}; {ECO:0000250/UniProtKB:Q12246}; AltName: Full=Sphinganine kinase 4 {ECO:0000305} [Serendipita indica DSM 11827]|nr:Sphingoid long chain base kinase 4 {ECO:0000250/UniProtKB:Q12246} Short=LCB kinase 4 {ECO:0000250/UniProtKB:Q12246}; {ECO:0000250/UniProtKB:Q12246}; AltName: Full=Sphinganine kinase 4 {ECO:0000305} [Serendipita indica DSM 11827]
MSTDFPHVLQVASGRLEYNDEAFRFMKQSKSFSKVPLINILWVELNDEDQVVVTTLAPTSGKLALHPVVAELRKSKAKTQKEKDKEAEEIRQEAQRWADKLLDAAYKGLKRNRKLRAFLNPIGGKGKGAHIYQHEVEPIFAAARCKVEFTSTAYQGHMVELAQKVDLDVDAIVVLSGDGGIHEVVNGLAKHEQAARALRIPVAQISTGSANAVCVNILGPKDAFDIGKCCLNAIKGRPMKLPIYSIKQGDKKYFSFLTQAGGLMADLDLGTEHLRWMGDTRFVLGYLRGVVSKKICPVEIEYRLVQSDKVQMAASAKTSVHETHFHEDEDMHDENHKLPWHADDDEPEGTDGWTKFEKPVMYYYAGGLPYVSRDLMQFPVANPSDGCIDLVIQSRAPRAIMLKATVGAEKGEAYWIDSQHYFKVSGYRVKPTGKGNFTVDGEGYPFEPFELRVHAGQLRVLSLDGRLDISSFTPDDAILDATK